MQQWILDAPLFLQLFCTMLVITPVAFYLAKGMRFLARKIIPLSEEEAILFSHIPLRTERSPLNIEKTEQDDN